MYVWVEWARKSKIYIYIYIERERKSKTAEFAYIQGSTVWIFSKPLPLRFPRVKIFSGLYNFPNTPRKLRGHPPPMHCTWIHLLPGMPSTQLLQQVQWRNSCVQFTVGNWCKFCNSTHATYAACQRDLSVNMYTWK